MNRRDYFTGFLSTITALEYNLSYTEEIDSSYGYYGYDHESSGLKDELDSYLSRVTTEEIKQQILNQLS
jgi:hypothetical protein